MTAGEIIEILSRVPADTTVEAETAGGEFAAIETVSTLAFGEFGFSAVVELDR